MLFRSGVAALLLALSAVATETMFWVWTMTLSLLFSLATPISAIPYQLHIPLVSSLQPTRLLVIVDFSLSVLGAYGLSYLIKGKKQKIFFVSIVFVALLYGILWTSTTVPQWFGITVENIAVAKRNLVIPTIFFLSVSAIILLICNVKLKVTRPVKRMLVVVLVIIAAVDLFRFSWKFTPFTDAKYFFPRTNVISFLEKQPKPYRIMTTDDRIFPPDVNEFYGIESINGYDPIHSQRFGEFITAMESGTAEVEQSKTSDRIIVPKNISSPLVSLLNVRYILSFDSLRDSTVREVFREGKTRVYEKTNFLPRAYLVGHAIFKKTKQEVMSELQRADFDLTGSAIVEYPVSLLNFPLETQESAMISHYEDDAMTVHTVAAQARLLVIGNAFDPHWAIYVDNKPEKLYRTNYLFMGAVIPAGSHEVTLVYK